MKKISIIIPNHNGAQYIERCLDSVLEQDYLEKEIIIVDDGSDDDSVSVIQRYIDSKKGIDIKLVRQSNLNAAIARNKGMSVATGHYVFFLDSDDLLESGALSKLVSACRQSDTDLVIGSYKMVDLGRSVRSIDEKIFTENSEMLDVKSNYNKLIDMSPVPSNKLYNLKLIKDNELEWGNVRIGQDLNFFLKYLLLCKKVVLINEFIYQHRVNKNSMSRTYDYRIFDIVNSFADVEKYYYHNKESVLFRKNIPFLELKHYSYQLSKSVYFKNRQDRSLVVRYFSVAERKIDYSACVTNYRRLRMRFRLKCVLRPLYISGFYCLCKRKKQKGIL